LELQKKLISILFAIALVLILTDIIIDKIDADKPKVKLNEVSSKQLEERLFTALNNYGIKENWIEKRNFKNHPGDSLTYRFFITLPGDLPHLEVLREFFSLNPETDVKIRAREEKQDTRTLLKVSVNDEQKLEATFRTIPDTLRNYPTLTFLITKMSELSREQSEHLLAMPYSTGICIPPTPDGDVLRERAKFYNKQFFVMINDQLQEPYILEPDETKSELNKAIQKITTEYKGATGFIIDNNSELYNSVIFSFLRDRFAEKNCVLYSMARYKKLDSESIDDLLSRIYFYAKSSGPDEKKLFLIPAEKFHNIIDDINKLRKFGYKLLVHPLSEYL